VRHGGLREWESDYTQSSAACRRALLYSATTDAYVGKFFCVILTANIVRPQLVGPPAVNAGIEIAYEFVRR